MFSTVVFDLIFECKCPFHKKFFKNWQNTYLSVVFHTPSLNFNHFELNCKLVSHSWIIIQPKTHLQEETNIEHIWSRQKPTYADKSRHTDICRPKSRHMPTEADICRLMPTYADQSRHMPTKPTYADNSTKADICRHIPTMPTYTDHADIHTDIYRPCRHIPTYIQTYTNICWQKLTK